MNRAEFVRAIASTLRENGIKKPVSVPKHVFHISDDEGNTRDFSVKRTDKSVFFTIDDVDCIVNAAMDIIKDILQRGDELAIQGFGALGVRYRKPRVLTNVDDGKRMVAEGRYVPKFWPGKDLKMAAKVYGLNMADCIDRQNDEIDESSEDE